MWRVRQENNGTLAIMRLESSSRMRYPPSPPLRTQATTECKQRTVRHSPSSDPESSTSNGTARSVCKLENLWAATTRSGISSSSRASTT